MGLDKLQMSVMKILWNGQLKSISPSSSLRLFSTSASKDLFDVLEEKIEEDVGYDQWLANTKEALKTSKGRFWLGKTTPFPYNSAFVPKPILSDSSKSKIFEFFKQNPNADFRALSHQFKVSIERIKAIIRQKELEIDLASKGKTVDKEFISIIESNLECVEFSDENLVVKDQTKRLPFRPIFACVPEGRGFNFQDAKNVLALSGINVKTPSATDSKSNHENISQENVKVLSHSPFEKARSKFIFVDLKKNKSSKETSILVRDCDGTLRTPTRKEIENACTKTWNRNSPKII